MFLCFSFYFRLFFYFFLDKRESAKDRWTHKKGNANVNLIYVRSEQTSSSDAT